MNYKIIVLVYIVLFAGCTTKDTYYNPNVDEKLTVAKAQEIQKGMSSAEVVGKLGTPNIITKDESKQEVWVYDKTTTQNAKQNTSGIGGLWTLTTQGLFGGIWGGQETSASSERTLTIIIKFDSENRVKDVVYRTSSF